MSDTKVYDKYYIFSDKGKNLALLVLRLFFGAMIIHHGLLKMADYETLRHTFPNPFGLGSKWSLILIMTTEILGGIFLILGFLTRLAAIALAIGMCVAAFATGQPFSMSNAEMPLSYMFVFISLIIAGAGAYSLDRYVRKLFRHKE